MSLLSFALHPGRILREEFMEPLDLGSSALSRRLGVPRSRIEDLVREKRAVTADTALRLARVFGTTPQFWLNMQASFDLAQARSPAIEAIEPLERA